MVFLVLHFGDEVVHAYNMVTNSVSESKRHGYYIQDVNVDPSEFNWEGHRVKLHEAWLEGEKGKRSTSDFMLFVRFEMDNNLTNEHKFCDIEKRRLILMLAEPVQYDSYCMHLPARLWVKALAGGSYGDVVHGLSLSKIPSEPLKIIVGTCNNGHSKPVLTDVKLTCTFISQR